MLTICWARSGRASGRARASSRRAWSSSGRLETRIPKSSYTEPAMPSLSERQRNNVKAGVFVSIALLLGIAVVMVLTDAIEQWRRQTRRYTVIFDVASGVPNLKRGSDVRVGGLRMGEVSAIEPRLAPDTRTLKEIAVRFNLDNKAQLFRDAQIFVSAPLIGSEGWLDIPSVGDVA